MILENNPINRLKSERERSRRSSVRQAASNPNRQQIIAYKCRLLAQLADVLAPGQSAAARKALRVIADELFNIAGEVLHLEPEESDIDQVLAGISN